MPALYYKNNQIAGVPDVSGELEVITGDISELQDAVEGIDTRIENIITLPRINRTALPSASSDTETYLKEWVDYMAVWIPAHYTDWYKCILVGIAVPNSAGFVCGHMYPDNQIKQYATFFYHNLNGEPIHFGYYNNVWYFKQPSTSGNFTKRNNIVIYRANSWTNKSVIVPEGYRPNGTHYFYCEARTAASGGTYGTTRIWFSSDGTVSLSGTNYTEFLGTFVWTTAQ